MFTVIKSQSSKQEPKRIDYKTIYRRMFSNSLKRYAEDFDDRNSLLNVIYSGVKFISLVNVDDIKEVDEIHLHFATINVIKNLMSLITPRELVQTFPIEKKYDGCRTETKDYFSTIKFLNKHGFDTLMGDKLVYILWAYMDELLFKFQFVEYDIVSILFKMETGTTPMQRFFEEQGVETYTLYTDQKTKNKYLINSKGKRTKIKKQSPRYLRVVKN